MSGRIYQDVVTVGNVSIYQVAADPNGVLDAAVGSLAIQNSPAQTWQNTDGLTSWNLIGAGSPGDSFVYRPGGPQIGNVYSSWADLYAAMSVVTGPRYILFDPTFSPITIPNLGFLLNMDNVFAYGPFDGDPAASFTRVNIADGVTMTSFPISSYLLEWRSLSSQPIVTFTGVKSIFLDNGVIVRADGTAPFFRVLAGGVLLLVGQGVVIWSSGVSRVCHLDNGATLFLGLWNSSDLQFNSISGDPGSSIVGTVGASVAFAAQPTFFGFNGSGLADRSDRMRSIDGTAAGTWAGVAPATVAEAINRLANAVRNNIVGVPIP